MEEWLERYAQELGVPALTDDERAVLLRLARDVAHGTERRFAPLSTFLAGVAAGRQGGDRRRARTPLGPARGPRRRRRRVARAQEPPPAAGAARPDVRAATGRGCVGSEHAPPAWPVSYAYAVGDRERAMVTVRCGSCGDVSVEPALVDVLVNERADFAIYVFACPVCAAVTDGGDRGAVRQLLAAGAHRLELRSTDDPPLTHDDLLAFHELLEADPGLTVPAAWSRPRPTSVPPDGAANDVSHPR